jgi:hypothetical protein
LHIAAGEGHLDCVDVLLRRGFGIGTRDKTDNATACIGPRNADQSRSSSG